MDNVVRLPDVKGNETEAAMLGGLLLMPEAIVDYADVLRPDDFGVAAHRMIYAAMLALAEKNVGIDIVTLNHELREAGQLGHVGGIAYLSTLDSHVPSIPNLGHYAGIIRAEAARRRLSDAAAQIGELARDKSIPPDEATDKAQELVHAVADASLSDGVETVRSMIRTVFDGLEERFRRQTEVTGLPTGLTDLDRLTTGMHPGELIIVAGRPSMGKTALAMGIAGHVAIKKKLPVAVFSLEMPKEQLLERMLAWEGGVDAQRIRTGRFDEHDWPKLAGATDRIRSAPLVIEDRSVATSMQIRARCRRIKAALGGLSLVVVDYLQLMSGTGREHSREQEISSISRNLKTLAGELGCPVIALSQLSRALESRTDKRPMLSDLRESGAIEQDADVVVFVYRDEVYFPNKDESKGVAELIVGKQRNGPIGTVRVAYRAQNTRFENLARSNFG